MPQRFIQCKKSAKLKVRLHVRLYVFKRKTSLFVFLFWQRSVVVLVCCFVLVLIFVLAVLLSERKKCWTGADDGCFKLRLSPEWSWQWWGWWRLTFQIFHGADWSQRRPREQTFWSASLCSCPWRLGHSAWCSPCFLFCRFHISYVHSLSLRWALSLCRPGRKGFHMLLITSQTHRNKHRICFMTDECKPASGSFYKRKGRCPQDNWGPEQPQDHLRCCQ